MFITMKERERERERNLRERNFRESYTAGIPMRGRISKIALLL